MTREEKKLAAHVRRLEMELGRVYADVAAWKHEDGEYYLFCPPVSRPCPFGTDSACDCECQACWNRYLAAVEDGLFEHARSKRGLARAIAKTLERDDPGIADPARPWVECCKD